PRLIDDAALDVVADVREIVELAHERSNQRRFAPVQYTFGTRHSGDRLFQPDEIARSGAAECGSGGQALEILHALEGLAKLAAIGAAKRELLNRVQPIPD